MTVWTKKYQPKSSGEIVGQPLALKKIRTFLEHGSNSALLLYGPAGTGKSSSVYALARELDYEVLEINSSDVRNKEAISRVVGGSSTQASLFMKKKLILIDEADGVSGMKDRGGNTELVNVIKKSAWPIILTCNDAYSDKLKALRKVCSLVEFNFLEAADIFIALKSICEAEKVDCSEELLKSLSWQVGGDLRSAIADLQNLAIIDNTITSLDGLGGRMQRGKIEDALRLIFKSTSAEVTLNKFDDTSLQTDECMLWLDENLPREYSGEDLARAYECVSRADVFKGRIRRRQHWRFLVYINALLTAGVAVSKDEKNPKAVDYRRSVRILMLWQAKMRNAKKKSIAEKVAAKTHCSSKHAFSSTVPYLKTIFRSGMGQEITRELELDEDEVSWLVS